MVYTTFFQRVSDKRSELKALDRKVRPMEDLFSKFRAWMQESEGELEALTPVPSLAEKEDRNKTLTQAQVQYYYCYLIVIKEHSHVICAMPKVPTYNLYLEFKITSIMKY